MKKYIYLAFLCLFTLISCDENKEPAVTLKNEIKVKVFSTDTWNPTTNKMDTVVGATVNLISDSGTSSVITDNKGIATFSNVTEGDYIIVAKKDNLCNLINTSVEGDMTIGNLIIGVYTSEEDIEQSAFYANARVGGNKLADANGDGLINNYDKVQGQSSEFEYQYKDLNGDGLIDVKDLSNGKLIQIDHQVKETIFIGK